MADLITVEYIGDKREMGDKKSITIGRGTWIFNKGNSWTHKVPQNIAVELSNYPTLFDVKWDEHDEIAILKAEIALLKEKQGLSEDKPAKKPGRPKKEE
jgi:hypothetical protein